MKLNINPKELIALHNLLYDRFEGTLKEAYLHKYATDEEEQNADETQLRQVYNRVRACIIGALSSKTVTDPLDSWLQGQERKIEVLNEQNDEARKDIQGLKDQVKKENVPPVVLSADDADIPDESYPRKAPKPTMPRPGKFHGHRR